MTDRMKRRYRSEYEWSEVPTPSVGSVQVSSGAEELSISDFAAVLWVPDIDARHKWREYVVAKPKPGSRPVGFRR